jgi:hypothetical protein
MLIEYAMFVHEQVLRKKCEQRPSIKEDLESNVTWTVGDSISLGAPASDFIFVP